MKTMKTMKTNQTKPVIHNGSLYSYSAGAFCGVFIKESTMRKLAKLQAEHLLRVKSLLSDENDKGNVFPSHWALHYPEGKQTNVHFISALEDAKTRIKNATTSQQPRHHGLIFIADGMEEARQMADTHHENN